MHEHVGEKAPRPGTVSWVIHQRALHVFRVVGLEHPLVETCPVAQEHDDLGTLVLGLVKTRDSGGPGAACRQAHLGKGDRGHEHGGWAGAVPVEVPAAVHLTGQDLVGHIAHKPLVDTQARLIQQPIPGQCPLSVSNGSLEAAGALAADLKGRSLGVGDSIVPVEPYPTWLPMGLGSSTLPRSVSPTQ